MPVSGTLKRSFFFFYLSYFAIIHIHDKAILVSSGKRSSRASRPLGLLFVIHYDVLAASVSVIKQSVKAHWPLVYI